MPSMYDIYDHHASEYDELVNNEDWQGHLKTALSGIVDFTGAQVAEFGAGTGRLTRHYIEAASEYHLFDRSSQMLDTAAVNLAGWSGKIRMELLSNEDIGTLDRPAPESCDIVLEGWSFGHSVYDAGDDARGCIENLIGDCMRLLKSGGTCLIIETLGTCIDEAAAPAPFLDFFYRQLEADGFDRTTVRTDYRFETVAEASRIMGFFFGEEMEDRIRRINQTTIPEFTGIWHRLKN